MNHGPDGLAQVVGQIARERLVEGSTRAVRYLKSYGDPGWGDIASEDLRRVVGSFTARLRA